MWWRKFFRTCLATFFRHPLLAKWNGKIIKSLMILLLWELRKSLIRRSLGNWLKVSPQHFTVDFTIFQRIGRNDVNLLLLVSTDIANHPDCFEVFHLIPALQANNTLWYISRIYVKALSCGKTNLPASQFIPLLCHLVTLFRSKKHN